MSEEQEKYNVTEVDELNNADKTVSFGEHLKVKKAENTTFIVKNDAKLTVDESKNCRFFHELKGVVEAPNDQGSIKQDV